MAKDSPLDQVATKPNQGQVSVPAASLPCARVVSVSARALDVKSDAAMSFPSPEEIQSLRQMIAQANSAAERIERAHRGGMDEPAKGAIAGLQERLQLAAQMLQAFQAQITRIEMSIAELKAQEKKAQVAEVRAQQRVNDMDVRMESALERFARKLDELSQAALANLQTQFERSIHEAAAGAAAAKTTAPDFSLIAATMQEMAEQMARLTDPAHGAAAAASQPIPSPGAGEPLPLRFPARAQRA